MFHCKIGSTYRKTIEMEGMRCLTSFQIPVNGGGIPIRTGAALTIRKAVSSEWEAVSPVQGAAGRASSMAILRILTKDSSTARLNRLSNMVPLSRLSLTALPGSPRAIRRRKTVLLSARNAEGRRVVLKRFRPKMFRENSGENHHEAVILSGLAHPAVPEFLGVLNLRQGYFFILEYKPGSTLRSLLFRQRTEFTDEQIFRIGAQLLDVLIYLHSRSVVHGDLSISNVVDDGRQVSLLDFGLARYMDGRDISADLDYSCFGNVLLYLLYSRYHEQKFGA